MRSIPLCVHIRILTIKSSLIRACAQNHNFLRRLMPGSCTWDVLLHDSCSVAYIKNESEISIWSVQDLQLHHRVHFHSVTAWTRRCYRSGVRRIPLRVPETGQQHQVRGGELETWQGKPSFPRCVFSVWSLKATFFQPFKTWRNPYLCPTFRHEIVSFLPPVWAQHSSLCVDLCRETQWAGRSHLIIPQQLTPRLSVKAAVLLRAS